MPTLPGSTVKPDLLVDGGPENAAGGESLTGGAPASPTSQLRWVIVGLVVVGLAIAGLTVAFWRHTRPRPPRRAWDDERGRGQGPPAAGPGPGPGPGGPVSPPVGQAAVPRGDGWDPSAPTVSVRPGQGGRGGGGGFGSY
jgi:hypothetical protein